MQYSFLLAPLLSSLSAFRMYLIAAGSAVNLISESLNTRGRVFDTHWRVFDTRGRLLKTLNQELGIARLFNIFGQDKDKFLVANFEQRYIPSHPARN